MILRTIDNFLTEHQCKHLIKVIDKQNHKSTVASDGGTAYEEQSRNSSTSYLPPDDLVVRALLDKAAETLGIDKSLAEGVQGQLYEPGQYFKPHFDWFQGKDLQTHCKSTGNRSHTLMIYLNDDFEGGKTDFSTIQFTGQPQTGRAITWTNLKSDGSGDPDALHEGQQVTKGKKYIVTTWWRTGIPLPDKTTSDKTFTSHEDFPKLTPKGYKVVDIPKDTWEFIQKMWKEVQSEGPQEEIFDGKEGIITGQGVTSHLYSLDKVSLLRDELHDMLLPMHEEFCGEKLEKTFIYGVREYLKGANLIQHKDRIETHHISSIILLDKNLKCGCKTKELGADWALDFQTHDGTWEKVYLEPGQMVLYESTTCLHGRNDRFEGTYYRNFFVHYKLKDWQYKA